MAAVLAGAWLALGSGWLRGPRSGVATAQSAPTSAGSSVFHPLPPCRILDTRLPDGPLGGPYLFADSTRVFEVAGVCGIPETAGSLAVNVTVTGGTGFGSVNLYAADLPPPSTLVIAFAPGQSRANNAIVALGPPPARGLAAANGPAVVHLIVDVTGYFESGGDTPTPTPTATPHAHPDTDPDSAGRSVSQPHADLDADAVADSNTHRHGASLRPRFPRRRRRERPRPPPRSPSRSPTATTTPAGDAPTIRIVSPVDGATIAADTVSLSGTYSGPPDTGVSVNGVPAPAAGGTFTVDEFQLLPGANTFVVTATAPDGRSAESAVTVTSVGVSPVVVRADPRLGPAPLAVRFSLGNRTGRILTRVDLDMDADGTVDYATTDPTVPFVVNYPNAGVFSTRLTIRDDQASTYVRDVRIVVLDPAEQDALFRGIWARLNAALSAGDSAAARRNLTGPAGAKYGPVFDALLPELPAIVSSYTDFTLLEMSPSIAEYVLTRTIDGQPRSFLVTFLLGADGVWRIEAM